jgi:hypothetical protein
MIRKILWVIAILFVVDLATVLGGYGIRLKEKPCTHLTGMGINVNYVTQDCARFRWSFAIP